MSWLARLKQNKKFKTCILEVKNKIKKNTIQEEYLDLTRQLTETVTQNMHVSLLLSPRACSIVIYCETM